MWGVLNHKLFCRHSLLCIRAPDLPYSLLLFSALGEKKAAACDFPWVPGICRILCFFQPLHVFTQHCAFYLCGALQIAKLCWFQSLYLQPAFTCTLDSLAALYGYKV